MWTPSWYVLQVETGRELATCEAVERVCRLLDEDNPSKSPIMRECFAPRYATQVKLRGEWVDEDRLLLPGYVVAVTDEPWRLARALGKAPGFARVLTMGKTFAPLSEDDKSWIERWTNEGERTIPMSIAYKEGDRIVVASGPLKDHEGMITKIKRRKNVAELEIHAGQLTIRTTVGLAVLPTPNRCLEE